MLSMRAQCLNCVRRFVISDRAAHANAGRGIAPVSELLCCFDVSTSGDWYDDYPSHSRVIETRGRQVMPALSSASRRYGSKLVLLLYFFCVFVKNTSVSPRTISTAWLHGLPRFHLQPINRVISPGPYQLNAVRYLILG